MEAMRIVQDSRGWVSDEALADVAELPGRVGGRTWRAWPRSTA